jgi:hypothetical protein
MFTLEAVLSTGEQVTHYEVQMPRPTPHQPYQNPGDGNFNMETKVTSHK